MTTVLRQFVRFARLSAFRLKGTSGGVRYGDNFIVGPDARIARGAVVRVGNRVNIGASVTIHTDLEVGDDVMISSSVAFIGNDHDFSDPALTIQEQGLLPRARIILEGDNLIGFGSIIIGNVVIGRGAIVGAGSLVTRDVPANTICAGHPAKAIRLRRP